MDRKLETKAVNAALMKAGIIANVKHGTGSAWGWLKVHVTSAPAETTNQKVIKIVQTVTGRHGDYDGCINVHSW
jgi:hypothetical protein